MSQKPQKIINILPDRVERDEPIIAADIVEGLHSLALAAEHGAPGFESTDPFSTRLITIGKKIGETVSDSLDRTFNVLDSARNARCRAIGAFAALPKKTGISGWLTKE